MHSDFDGTGSPGVFSEQANQQLRACGNALGLPAGRLARVAITMALKPGDE
jgi:hypothetical protein